MIDVEGSGSVRLVSKEGQAGGLQPAEVQRLLSPPDVPLLCDPAELCALIGFLPCYNSALSLSLTLSQMIDSITLGRDRDCRI